jgi:hypothetical protein
MKRFLIIAISGLALTGCLHDFREDEKAQQHAVYKDKPIGAGDPRAISCYRPLESISRLRGLECRPNAEWAQIAVSDKRNSSTDIGNRAGGAAVVVTQGR